MKRKIAAFLIAAFLIPAVNAGASGPPELSAASAILLDGESGRVLFEKNAYEERSIASITKLMTALVAVEMAGSLQEPVTIQKEWTGIEGSSLYLKPGETVSLETLIYGLLLHSGNDAAVAIAGYCAGSVELFVQEMNRKALLLGMQHTHFANPNGLSEEGHYSTAYDMALLGQACLNNPVIAKIMSTRSISLEGRSFTNHNKLLWFYKGCTGMKTGFTEDSGRTLVSSAECDGKKLIAVTLNAPDDWQDHKDLFDYGFEMFQRSTLCTQGDVVGYFEVEGSLLSALALKVERDMFCLIKNEDEVRSEIILDQTSVQAPLQAGTVFGTMSFYLGDELLGRVNIVSGVNIYRDEVETMNFLDRLREILFH